MHVRFTKSQKKLHIMTTLSCLTFKYYKLQIALILCIILLAVGGLSFIFVFGFEENNYENLRIGEIKITFFRGIQKCFQVERIDK